jgi:hypothetical protein
MLNRNSLVMPFDTHLLDAAIARRRERNEVERRVILRQVMQWLETQGQTYGIQRAYLFGSLLRPYHFTERSDVDVAVETIAPDDFFMAIASLSEFVGRDVDLVDLSKCHFAHRIRQQGKLWRSKT